MSPKARVYLYLGSLGVFSFAMLGSGVMDVLQPGDFAAQMQHVGVSPALTALLGVWKLLGVAALLAPKLPRLKEWAYAGFAFDLSGAAVAHLSSGDGFGKAIVPLFLLGLGLASWALRPDSRRLP